MARQLSLLSRRFFYNQVLDYLARMDPNLDKVNFFEVKKKSLKN